MKAPFPIDEFLTGITLAYTNRKLIADSVLPRIQVGKQEFKWNQFSKEERFTVPNTNVGRTSRVNEIEFGATEQTSSTKDYGLEDPIPQNDIDNAFEGYNPVSHAAEALTDLIMLDREIRVASVVFDAATYPAGNKAVLGAGEKFDDDTSKPIAIISDALDVPVMRPNVMVIGRDAWRSLSQHPQIVKAANRNDGDAGIATRRAVAEIFELDEILVGEGFVNTAKPGQSPTFARVWGEHVSLIHRNNLANNRRGITFGFSAQWGGRVAGQSIDPNIGLRGGTRVRVGESIAEVIASNDSAYFLEDTLT